MPEIDAKTGEPVKEKSEKTLRLEALEAQAKEDRETIAALKTEIADLKKPKAAKTDADEWLDGDKDE